MSNLQTPPSETPLRSHGQLLDYFREGIKPPAAWGIGLEYERVGVYTDTGAAIPYSGERGVEAVLSRMAAAHGWRRQEEAGRTIALNHGASSITLEPGGQMELSGRVHGDLCSMSDELAGHLGNSKAVSDPLGITWLPLGLQPVTPIEQIEWVPKGRYKIMGPFLGSRGRLAHHMMKGTAGVQLNFDYASEEDAADKLRTAMGITSILTAVCANSPIYAGKRAGFLSRRAHIWTDTDPARCGLLEFALRESLSFQDYKEYALDVPLLFVLRDGEWLDLKGITFRRFMDGGYGALRPTLGDWALHLTTIFTEVRLKTYVEVRGSDSVVPDLVMALAAFWKGILYDERSRGEAWRLVESVSFAERLAFHHEAAARGPLAAFGRRPAIEVAKDLLAAAREGLARVAAAGTAGPCRVEKEKALLNPLEAVLESEGGCPAATVIRLWESGGIAAILGAAHEADSAFVSSSTGTAP